MSNDEITQAEIDAGWAKARARYEDRPVLADTVQSGVAEHEGVAGWNAARARYGVGPIPAAQPEHETD